MSKNYNTALQTNNSSLEELIVQLNNLPSADEGGLDTSDATATSGDILNGKTAYVKGEKVTGNIAFQPAQTITPGTANQTIASGKYLEGAITIKGDANLVAGNIVSGKSIFGVVGTATTGGGGDTSLEDAFVTRVLTTYTNDRVANIGLCAFVRCYKLTSVSFPQVTHIGDSAFAYCSQLTSVSFPQATTIGSNAFYGCTQLTSINFPQVKGIGMSAFCACDGLTSVNFPQVATIANNAFAYCSQLTSVSFSQAYSFGSYAFVRCYKLTSVSFPQVATIANNAFAYCSQLTSVSFPQATTIGSSVFYNCSKLASIFLGGSTLCSLKNSNAFSGTSITSTTGSIFVPASLLASYKKATNWTYFSNRIFSYNF